MSKQPRTDTTARNARPASERTLDQRMVIALTEYVQKLGGMERARQALDALDDLKRAA